MSDTHRPSDGHNPLRCGTRYRPHRVVPEVDVLVIGAGLGGLSSAILLAQSGLRVQVLERHYTAGGFTHAFARKGHEWDVGVHYVGEMAAGSQARRIMDRLTGGRLEWAPLGPVYDEARFGDDRFAFRSGRSELQTDLTRRFPDEAGAIERYLELIARCSAAMPLVCGLRLLPQPVGRMLRRLAAARIPPECARTTRAVLQELTDNTALQAILCTQWGNHGVPPGQSSFLMHALVAHHYLKGAWYPVGGSARIGASLVASLRAAGGEVFTQADVAAIELEGGRAVGVRMADGTLLRARTIISSAGVHNTFGRLLPPWAASTSGYAAAAAALPASHGHLCLYVALQGTASELELPSHNVWVFPGYDHDAQVHAFLDDAQRPLPVAYLSFPPTRDPDFARRHPHHSTLELIAPSPPGLFEPWRDTPWGRRGAGYDALKAQWTRRLLDVMYQQLPQLRGRVVHSELSTPLSTRHFCNWPAGELYGLEHTPERFAQDWLRPRTRIPGLWLTGQDVLSCGVVGAMMAGCLSAIAVRGWRGLGLAAELFGPPRP